MPRNLKLKDIGEFGLIERIKRSAVTRKDVAKGIGDDCAVLSQGRGKYLLLTADMLKEGVHFTLKAPAFAIGYKAMACSLSDIAAMGGLPKWAVVSAGLSKNTRVSFAKGIYRGMDSLCRKFHFSIVGGDTIASKDVVLSVALVGEVEKKNLVTRGGAKVGDKIFVTGKLGGSLRSGRHYSFVPRIKEARFLVKNFKPSAMIDISDGLAGDLNHILEESKVGAVILGEKIPKYHRAQLQNALYDGEDFELLFTLSPQEARRLQTRSLRPFPFFCIGDIVEKKEKFTLCDCTGRRLPVKIKSFTHF